MGLEKKRLLVYARYVKTTQLEIRKHFKIKLHNIPSHTVTCFQLSHVPSVLFTKFWMV